MERSGRRDASMGIFWILLGLTISVWSATYPFGGWEAPGPAFLPFGLGLILVLLGGILFFQAMTRKAEGSLEADVPLVPERAPFRRVASALGGMFLAAAVFEHLGYILTVFLLILFLTRAIEPQKWRLAVFYALVCALGSVLFFQLLFKMPLPRGVLGF